MTESIIAIGSMFVLIALVIGVALYYGKKKGKVLAAKVTAAKVVYDQALDELQREPSNSNKYQNAMNLGREYYAFGNLRGDPQVQNVIETRLQTDLQARTNTPKII